MSYYLLSFSTLATLSAMLTFVIQRTHVLMALLALEAMILNLMIICLISLCPLNPNELFICMIILTFGACEAGLGLSCLVKMTRSFGNDMLQTISSPSC
uniref:NADH-ubiquinone oxidoreductase chain 4L n=1 Tax=Iphione sp. YZ-2018 TaxID=2153332 RepID=A0A343W6H6_9ANNE|nr:NADH dehydrogenase subunit 4L [Iphione sp. YZ-2018]